MHLTLVLDFVSNFKTYGKKKCVYIVPMFIKITCIFIEMTLEMLPSVLVPEISN